jgi:hypothetical protein
VFPLVDVNHKLFIWCYGAGVAQLLKPHFLVPVNIPAGSPSDLREAQIIKASPTAPLSHDECEEPVPRVPLCHAAGGVPKGLWAREHRCYRTFGPY